MPSLLLNHADITAIKKTINVNNIPGILNSLSNEHGVTSLPSIDEPNASRYIF